MIPALLFYMLLFPEKVLADSLAGLNLWFHTVLPSLLPFMILSNVLIGANAVSILMRPFSGFFRHGLGLSPEGGYAWLLGLFCGFPMGARLTGTMYREKKISREEADYLLTFANQSSPMFLSTYVILHGLRDTSLTVPVFAVFYGSAFLTGLVFRILGRRFHLPPSAPEAAVSKKEVSQQTSYGNLLDTSIMNGFEVITRLGGYIILFSILAGIVMQLPSPLHTAAPFLSGMTEITTGIHTISGTALSPQVKFIAVICSTAFGGLSTVAQTSCMLGGTGLSILTYLKGKLVNTLIAGLLCLVAAVLFLK